MLFLCNLLLSFYCHEAVLAGLNHKSPKKTFSSEVIYLQLITDYEHFLPRGAENAIPTHILVALMGFPSTRELRKDIAKSRAAGQVIASSSKGGYFIPATDAELEQFVATMRKKAISTFLAIRSARQLLKENKQQMNLEDFIQSEIDDIED